MAKLGTHPGVGNVHARPRTLPARVNVQYPPGTAFAANGEKQGEWLKMR